MIRISCVWKRKIDHETKTTPPFFNAVIVTAVNAETAVQQIARAGGVVTSRLTLIDAAGAQLNDRQILWLARQPGIESIVANKAVTTASMPARILADEDDDDDDNDERGRYGSNRRRTLAVHDIGSRPKVSPLLLPDGGFFVIRKGRPCL